MTQSSSFIVNSRFPMGCAETGFRPPRAPQSSSAPVCSESTVRSVSKAESHLVSQIEKPAKSIRAQILSAGSPCKSVWSKDKPWLSTLPDWLPHTINIPLPPRGSLFSLLSIAFKSDVCQWRWFAGVCFTLHVKQTANLLGRHIRRQGPSALHSSDVGDVDRGDTQCCAGLE